MKTAIEPPRIIQDRIFYFARSLVRRWTGSAPIDGHRSRDGVVASFTTALDAAGIGIPFPYRTLTFKEPLALDGHRAHDARAGAP